MIGVSRTDTIVCYGDSQTAGFQWGQELAALTGKTFIGRGVSGQEAGTVAVRQGGIVLTTTAACTIPTSGAVQVPVKASVTPCNIRADSSVMPMVLAGVRGTLTIMEADTAAGVPAWDRAAGVGVGSFTPDSAPTAAVAVPSGTAFISQDVADHPEWAECLTIFWAGGNDSAFAGASKVTGVLAAAQAVVARLKTAVTSPRFLVSGRTVRDTDVVGTTGYETAIAQRDALAAAWPDNAIDIWGFVRDNGLSLSGITPTAADVTAQSGGGMPPSLTSDGLHYTEGTRRKVLAPFILSELIRRDWLDEGDEEMAFTPNPDWKTGDQYPASRMVELETAVSEAEIAAETAQVTANGKVSSAELAAIQTALDGKVPIKDVASKNTVYGISNGGSLYMYPTGISTVAASTVAMRGTGGALKVGTATADDHAVTFKQLNDAIATLTAANTALAARVTALENPA